MLWKALGSTILVCGSWYEVILVSIYKTAYIKISSVASDNIIDRTLHL